MIYKGPSIYKSGLNKEEISELLTDWIDVTNEFTINDSNLELVYGKILKNEALKEIKISIRLDLISLESINQYQVIAKTDILSSNYNFEDGISSLSAAYIDNLGAVIPRGFCMMWNDEHTINVQITNPSDQTVLKGFIIEAVLVYK